MEQHLLGIDIGTSGTKTLICTPTGKVLATATAPHTLQSPKPGYSEQDPDQWWAATCKATRAVFRKAAIPKSSIQAIGLSGQMHGSVFLSKNHTPLRPAILWNDQRTAAECAEIESLMGSRKKLIKAVGNPALTGFTAPKILWLRNHQPRLYDRTTQILLPKDYIRFRMTSTFATDVADASGYLLLDIAKRKYNPTVLRKLQIDSSLLPPTYESHEVTAELSTSGAKSLGLLPGIPVVAGAGDNAAAAIGNGVTSPGILTASIGTSGVMFAHADTPTLDPDGRVHTMCSAVADKWCVFGCELSAGACLQWFHNNLAEDTIKQAKKQKQDPYTLLLQQASQTPPGAEGLYFLPYLTGERCPHPDPLAKAAWIGLTIRHTHPHLTRALVEGVTFGMNDILQILRNMQIPTKTIRLTGGGARDPFWRQLQADIYNSPVATVNTDEGPAYGAALLAAVGIGLHPDIHAACKTAIEQSKKLKPNRKLIAFYKKQHAQYQRLYHALASEYQHIANLINA
ncbi:Xylulose kinase [Poriferisphaera corsica]|uniref:Xylulose kinase n=1 Tax=Poriferisphaera corsica TaxID=2528020 RepID=A0A517YY94_9BACT|nr:xylulokinase [Poriferisphaera corsica]QDU35186.1 Xylulose kinase [Poriferisphaera corsica]